MSVSERSSELEALIRRMSDKLDNVRDMIELSMREDDIGRERILVRLGEMEQICTDIRTCCTALSSRGTEKSLPRGEDRGFGHSVVDGALTVGVHEFGGRGKFRAIIGKTDDGRMFLLRDSYIPARDASGMSGSAREMKRRMIDGGYVSVDYGVNRFVVIEPFPLDKAMSTVCSVICGYSTSFGACMDKFVKISDQPYENDIAGNVY